MHKKWSAIFMVSVLFLSIFTYTGNSASAAASFSDVPQNKPFASAVYKLAQRGIIGGYSDGTFKPGDSITRGQAASILANLLDLDTENVKDPGFKDVSPELWNYKAIAAVAEKGIFRGFSDGRFGPNDKITRAQMASTLIKAFDFVYLGRSVDTPFKDTRYLISHEYSINTLYKLGITSGTSPTTFSPNNPITRAQAAVLITKTEAVRSTAVSVKASDLGFSQIKEIEVYDKKDSVYQPGEDQVVVPLLNYDNEQEVQIVPIKEGKQKLVIRDFYVNSGVDDIEYQKYYVTVSEKNGQLHADLEKTDDIFPSSVSLRVNQADISNITLAKMDGTLINENQQFKYTHSPYPGKKLIYFSLDKPGEYIATVEYADGQKIRYGLEATEYEDFYYNTRSAEEIPVATVDLSKYPGNDFDYHTFNEDIDGGIIEFSKSGNNFKIKGLSEGTAIIRFPNNRRPDGIVEFHVRVEKIGPIISVYVSVWDYRDTLI
ncbi:S-layer homology domain-containing protein [Bacillus infantis]|uniref:S-layer homology domain-containing protein n=1 Tax=Bacillus infantis TaxID=324767 RepID=UPI0020030F1A|nr:S-layer homology domain-containing protein [Bacillus infantis]MCK6207136.1 S-layer homology domain-containing protein [Bacillus infantis]